MLIDVIAGARPNFMKIAALYAVSTEFPTLDLRFVHTGQHYDYSMSEIFIKQLGLPSPTLHLNVGPGSHAFQTAEIMKKYENWCLENPADLCVVVGDVNSTVACAIVAAKLGIKLAHVEAGLRSFDKTMPEEINRIITDSICDLHFVSEPSGITNLAKEGIAAESIHFVGQVMVDTVYRMLEAAKNTEAYRLFSLNKCEYAYVTLHRPSNVDHYTQLDSICHEIQRIADGLPIIFPLHPRTKSKLETFGLLHQLQDHPGVHLVDPVDYLTSLSLLNDALFTLTDSGGLQEEASALAIPCITLRNNTERPITVDAGTNILVGSDWDLLRSTVDAIIKGKFVRRGVGELPYWDGKSGQRILKIIETI